MRSCNLTLGEEATPARVAYISLEGPILEPPGLEIASMRVGHLSVHSRYHRLPRCVEDDYEITDRVLGSGINGDVHLALGKHARGSQAYAVKAFDMHNISVDKRAELDSEVAVFLEMDHPHVARLVDVYETSHTLHLVMEHLEGGELFDRVAQRRRFREAEAVHATRQMLLAVNYLHSHDIVHRDVKLENFVYDVKNSDHMKLIDFGFSRIWDFDSKLQRVLGSLAYVAPEVLNKSYTKQCDLWSLGVITFILLTGSMPFDGTREAQISSIKAGTYNMKPSRWKGISKEALSFVQALLVVDPEHRLTAESALRHAWLQPQALQAPRQPGERCVERASSTVHPSVCIDSSIVEGLRQFGQASRFRRACLETMAWSLSNEERAKVRDSFLALDATQRGSLSLEAFCKTIGQAGVASEQEARQIFDALDSDQDDAVHYSAFLAAMLTSCLALRSELLHDTFRRFDVDNRGIITPENLRQVLGDEFEGVEVGELLKEASSSNDNQISYEEFAAHLCESTIVPTADTAPIDSAKFPVAASQRSMRRWTLTPLPLRSRL